MSQLANKNNIKHSYTNNLFLKFSTLSVFTVFAIGVFILLMPFNLLAQETVTEPSKNDSLSKPLVKIDSLQIKADSLNIKNDSTKSSNRLEAIVKYKALDSIRFNLQDKKVYLFKEGEIDYQNINLKADDIKINFNENLLFAEGVLDSAGKLIGKPIFTEKDQEYKSKFMKYNYKTRKAFIRQAFTQDGEQYMHGEDVKKLDDESINTSHGFFTTCSNEECPHFGFQFNKSKAIPGDKLITGPAHLVIEGVHTPLFIPFGLFPNKKGRRSGVILPTWGESANRGFYFEDGGYYWAFNENLDLKLTGDIYTYGSWAVKAMSNYVKRYKYRGSFNLTFAKNKEIDDEGSRRDFAIRWQHAQDSKARPNSRFTANVNIVSSKYNTYNPTTSQDYLSSTFQSGISYQTQIAGKHSLTVNASHSQNTQSRIISVTFPQISFGLNQFYPFRKKDKVGGLKWYEKISMKYNMNAQNTISVADSLLFKPGFEKKMRNGVKQTIPISLPLKLFKYFNLTTSMNITDRVYFSSIRKLIRPTITDDGKSVPEIVTDTVYQLENVFDYSLSAGVSTKLYGMVNFKKGPVRAIRHVITPSASLSYTPDFSTDQWGYYDKVYTNSAQTEFVKYSRFEQSIYGSPSNRKSAAISFSISNNLEMKVPSKKDTVNGLKKVVLIESLSISTSYDFTRDSLNWSPVSVSGRTTLFKKLKINYSSTWNPYAVDADGQEIDQYEWDFRKKLLRHESTRWNFSMNYSFTSPKKKDDKGGKPDAGENISGIPNLDDPSLLGSEFGPEAMDIRNNPDDYVDWSIPWKLNVSYSLSKTNNISYERLSEDGQYKITKDEKITAHTVNLSGDLSLTPKTKLTFRTGYDFKNKNVSFTSINIYRDLHCWEMRFNWIPIGARKSWNFTIAIKSTLLQDLKLEKKKDFRDR